MRAGLGVAGATVMFAAACATIHSPVPVVGDVSSLAGTWAGEYEGLESGRRGSIVFELTAGRDTAFGDVLMTPSIYRSGNMGVIGSSERPVIRTDEIQASHVLTIAFTRVHDGRVSGTLDPYPSPDCGCTLVTTFTGDLRGDHISGTFISRHEDGSFEQGRWHVQRRPTK